jgi:hypothetical protein
MALDGQTDKSKRTEFDCPSSAPLSAGSERRLTARQISQKEPNSSVRRQPVRCPLRRRPSPSIDHGHGWTMDDGRHRPPTIDDLYLSSLERERYWVSVFVSRHIAAYVGIILLTRYLHLLLIPIDHDQQTNRIHLRRPIDAQCSAECDASQTLSTHQTN